MGRAKLAQRDESIHTQPARRTQLHVQVFGCQPLKESPF